MTRIIVELHAGANTETSLSYEKVTIRIPALIGTPVAYSGKLLKKRRSVVKLYQTPK